MSSQAQFDLYLDESGNTGANLDDPDQPISVYAGWLVRRTHTRSIESIVDRIARELPGKRSEIKGSGLFKSPAGRKAIGSLLDEFAGQPAAIQPVFTVWEKRYAIAIRVFETLLNPNAIPIVPEQFRSDRAVSIRTANDFYDLPDAVLLNVWHGIQDRNVDTVVAGIRALAGEFIQVGKSELAKHLIQVECHVEDALSLQSDVVDNDPTWKGLRGLHAQSLIGLLNDVERIGRSGTGSVTVYVDETREFRPILEAALQRKQREPLGERRISDDLIIRDGYITFDNINFARSQDCIVIQAADILAALLANQLRYPEKLANSNSELAEKTRRLISLSAQDNNAAMLVISKRFSSWLD